MLNMFYRELRANYPTLPEVWEALTLVSDKERPSRKTPSYLNLQAFGPLVQFHCFCPFCPALLPPHPVLFTGADC